MVAPAYRKTYLEVIGADHTLAREFHAPSPSGVIAIERSAALPTQTGLRVHDLLVPTLALGLLLVVTAAAVVFRQHLQGLDTMGYFGVFAANVVASATLVLPVPGLAATMGAALVWNPLLVALAGGTGSAVADLAGYLIGATSHKAVAGKLSNRRWYSRIEGWMQRRGFITIFTFAAIPNPLFDVAGLVAGSMGYSFKRFVVACWLGKMTKFLLAALVGYWGADLLMGLLG